MPEKIPAVYYASADCVGLFRRMFVDAVDGAVLMAVWVTAYIVLASQEMPGETARGMFFLMVLGSSFLYLVVLKYFSRTLGYLIGGVSVVNLFGKRPSLAATCLRAMFLFLGPGNFLLDIFWLTSDPHRQAIRDKFSRTYVIRHEAKPAGEGHIRYVQLDILNYHFVLPEVARNSNQNAPAAEKS